MLETGTGNMARRASYWTIAREGSCHSETLTIDTDGGDEALAVFGFREEADLFLSFQGTSDGWHIRETTAGELVSVLYGPHSGIERILIDPLPRGIYGGTSIIQLSIGRADFTRLLVEKVGAAPGPLPSLASLRP